tara:strand:- start:2 stop:265 length:264 start_codon:yes stop_codon:yes gene_type:complete
MDSNANGVHEAIMKLTRQQRRERRRNVIKKGIALSKACFPEDEEARREWLAALIAAQLDIPGLGEAAERKLFLALLDVIMDLVDGED